MTGRHSRRDTLGATGHGSSVGRSQSTAGLLAGTRQRVNSRTALASHPDPTTVKSTVKSTVSVGTE
ncbi:hypothetical protein WG66_001602 [Moniliophthora roreri]|nr:hypothetical protein WG66_001602 [Moniliophthora roreri]